MGVDPSLQRREVPNFFAPDELEMLLAPIEAEGTPQSKLLCHMAREQACTRAEVKYQSPILVETEFQSKRTNGRVTRIEQLILIGKAVTLSVLLTVLVLGALFRVQLAEVLIRILAG